MGAKERYNESLKKSGRKERAIKISIYKETAHNLKETQEKSK